ncbi:MAG: isoprenylcysteine carboxylmethyltransferase family protein [Gemmatimonadaceae bacterium]|nr:isoprenylcysteine carboxylmethyltransferase family protein [Gemmatimonadaceae bacterium]
MRRGGLPVRAVGAFLALPGTVAFLVPLALVGPLDASRPLALEGAVVVVIGCVVLAWCVRDFYVTGRGTLAPWSPPEQLVVVGLYRYSRNPMYVGVLLIVSGWALGFRSTALSVYALTLAALFQLRVVYGEEPWLARTHGEAWNHYARSVPRWIL